MLVHAFQTLLQDRAWFRRLLPLALLQLIPILGQLILIGYGLEVGRMVHAGRADLPALRPLPMLAAGGKLLVITVLYITPILIFLPTIATVGSTPVSAPAPNALPANADPSANPFGFGLILLALSIVLTPALKQAQQRGIQIPRIVFIVNRLIPIIGIITTVLSLLTNPPTLAFDLSRLNSVGIVLLMLWLLLALIIVMAAHIGGVRDAVEGKGLLDPIGSLRVLVKRRGASAMLIGQVLLVWLITAVATAAGLVLLVLPGLFAFVLGSLTTWVLFARFYAALSTTRYRQDFNQLAPA